MRFFNERYPFYCGIDLHTKTMYVCVVDDGQTVLHRNIKCDPKVFLKLLAPYRGKVVVGCECTFSWYWLADLCADEGIDFVLGHALYMKAVHGGKTKNDRIDSSKIAGLLRGGLFPVAYTYPKEMRSTRDLLRRRNHLMRKRAELLAHIQSLNSQANFAPFAKTLCFARNRRELDVAVRFEDTSVRQNVEADLSMIDHYDPLIKKLEYFIGQTAKTHDARSYYLLRSIPGIGKILALVLLYEIHEIKRFDRVQDFVSYSRLIKCEKSSAGKKYGYSGRKIGNAHLKWAFSEAVCLMLRQSDRAKKFVARHEKKHGKGKAMSILAAKIGRGVYYILKRQEPFEEARFFGAN